MFMLRIRFDTFCTVPVIASSATEVRCDVDSSTGAAAGVGAAGPKTPAEAKAETRVVYVG